MSTLHPQHSEAVDTVRARAHVVSAVRQEWKDLVERRFSDRRMRPLEHEEVAFLAALESFDRAIAVAERLVEE